MSLMDPLLRFIDSIAHREREADRRRARDTRADQPDPDPETSVLIPPLPAATTSKRQCRLCGQINVTHFCLVCLADTMEDTP